MKAKTDKLDSLLSAYSKASAKRMAKAKKSKDRETAQKKAREVFEEKVRQKITGVFRPVMQQLTARLGKASFNVTSDKLGFVDHILEQYHVSAKKEEYVFFWIALNAHEEINKVELSYAYSLDDGPETVIEKLYKVEEIDAALITAAFMQAFEKLCKA